MNILAMEADWWDRRRLESLLKKAAPAGNIYSFSSVAEALNFAKENPIDAAFIDLGGMHAPGYFLAKDIMAIKKTNIIFTNYEWLYMQEAFELRSSGYLRKPLRLKDINEEFENMRYPISEAELFDRRVESFEVSACK